MDYRLALAFPVAILILLTVTGNFIIIVSVPTIRKLREPSNFLYVSMAIADLMVGVLVVPMAGIYEIHDQWTLGIFWCNFWTYCDVLLCTSSILHLCIVSIDRYLVVKHPLRYSSQRSNKRMAIYAFGAWSFSGCVSLPMLVHFHAIVRDNECRVNTHFGYQIYATLAAFYIPVVVMIVINARIYITVRSIRRKDDRMFKYYQAPLSSVPGSTFNTAIADESNPTCASRKDTIEDTTLMEAAPSSTVILNHAAAALLSSLPGVLARKNTSSEQPAACNTFRNNVKKMHSKGTSFRRNTKAVKTLLIITVAFVGCWLPFFLTTLISSICTFGCHVSVPSQVKSVCLWLGYTNSAINPLLIVMFNKDFKQELFHLNRTRSRRVLIPDGTPSQKRSAAVMVPTVTQGSG